MPVLIFTLPPLTKDLYLPLGFLSIRLRQVRALTSPTGIGQPYVWTEA